MAQVSRRNLEHLCLFLSRCFHPFVSPEELVSATRAQQRRVFPGKDAVRQMILTELAPGIPVRVVFVHHRSTKNEWLTILLTDLALTVPDIIRIYRMRWEIEVFFKCAKSLWAYEKEDDLQIVHGHARGSRGRRCRRNAISSVEGPPIRRWRLSQNAESDRSAGDRAGDGAAAVRDTEVPHPPTVGSTREALRVPGRSRDYKPTGQVLFLMLQQIKVLLIQYEDRRERVLTDNADDLARRVVEVA